MVRLHRRHVTCMLPRCPCHRMQTCIVNILMSVVICATIAKHNKSRLSRPWRLRGKVRLSTPRSPAGQQQQPAQPDMLDSTNNMPREPNQRPWAGQQAPLSTQRVVSSIPKGGTADSWLYPSPQMFFNGEQGDCRGFCLDYSAGILDVAGPVPCAMQRICRCTPWMWIADLGCGKHALLPAQL